MGTCFGLITVTYLRHEIYADTMATLFVRLATAYAVPFGIVIGWMTAVRKRQAKEVPRLVSYGAIVLALTWNLLIVGRVAIFAWPGSDDTVGTLTAYLDAILPASYFLIGGGLSYFFAKHA